MIQSLNPFLNFDGNCAEAIEHYKSAVGAKENAVMRFDQMPEGDVSPEMAKLVMYARLDIGGGAIELSDVPPGMCGPSGLVKGNANNVAIHIDDPAELDRMVAALAEGGHIEMAPQDMFWQARFAKVVDKFGVAWTFNCQLGDPGLHEA